MWFCSLQLHGHRGSVSLGPIKKSFRCQDQFKPNTWSLLAILCPNACFKKDFWVIWISIKGGRVGLNMYFRVKPSQFVSNKRFQTSPGRWVTTEPRNDWNVLVSTASPVVSTLIHAQSCENGDFIYHICNGVVAVAGGHVPCMCCFIGLFGRVCVVTEPIGLLSLCMLRVRVRVL